MCSPVPSPLKHQTSTTTAAYFRLLTSNLNLKCAQYVQYMPPTTCCHHAMMKRYFICYSLQRCWSLFWFEHWNMWDWWMFNTRLLQLRHLSDLGTESTLNLHCSTFITVHFFLSFLWCTRYFICQTSRNLDFIIHDKSFSLAQSWGTSRDLPVRFRGSTGTRLKWM